MAASRNHLFDGIVLVAELKVAWMDIMYATLRLGVDKFVVKGNFAMMIGWIRR